MTDAPSFPYRPEAPDIHEQASAYLYVHDNPGCSTLDVARATHPSGTPTTRSFQAVKHLMHSDPPVLKSTFLPIQTTFRLYPCPAIPEETP